MTTSPPRTSGDLLPFARSGPSHAERAGRTQVLLLAAHEAGVAGDEVERQRLLADVVVLNHRVAQAVARRYQGRAVSDDDLEQAACEGLVKAALHFDPLLRHDFLSYAVPSIRGEVLRWFRDHSWTIRPPRRLHQLRGRLAEAHDELVAALGRQPTRDELCTRLGVDLDELAEVETSTSRLRPMSLDHPLVDDGRTLANSLALVAGHDRGHDDVDERTELAPALRRLAPRDREIVFLRFYEDRTQQEIGRALGITQMQVSRLLARILRDLRSDLGLTG